MAHPSDSDQPRSSRRQPLRLTGFGLGLAVIGLGVAGLGAAAALRPQLQPAPAAPVASAHVAAAVEQGRFRAAEAPVQGGFRIERRGGRQLLHLSADFRTNERAPDLKITFGRSATPIAGSPAPAFPLRQGSYTVVAPLQASAGSQTYELPADLDLSRYGSLIIWCEQFNATMAWAPLQG
ncbi:electron transfer flavoprotein [Synechococcus sp. RSCCF101]|uniref:DM13 domain-containing protein n=1 Tax=Synechococcus sp. RSCCF101 TaxID=2511069 RepID=UPI001248E647|nr:DM13 domain-containing protein [Synechococcus sp. RSCCF101]QEY31210.1 electron transfer flavoprotein [Synechococcus sp. RSCCF101]